MNPHASPGDPTGAPKTSDESRALAAGTVLGPERSFQGERVGVIDFSCADRIGEVPAVPVYFAGYSPPEMLEGQPVDPRIDVYAVGALLHHALTGRPLPEGGIELASWRPPGWSAGAPQI